MEFDGFDLLAEPRVINTDFAGRIQQIFQQFGVNSCEFLAGIAGSLRILAVPGSGGSPGYIASLNKESQEGKCDLNADEDGYEVNMGNSVYSTPVVANDVLFIASKNRLFAIAAE